MLRFIRSRSARFPDGFWAQRREHVLDEQDES
jgi:hypothetical protein